MQDYAEVRIWEQQVGVLRWNESRRLGEFEYYPEFVKHGKEIAPFMMPLKKGERYSFPNLRPRPREVDTFSGLPGLIADSLPDKYGNKLFDKWIAQQGRPPGSMSPVEKLLFIGTRGIGALTFNPAEEKIQASPSSIELNSLIEVAKKVLAERTDLKINLKEEEQEAMEQLLRIGTSAGGARPKAVIAFNPDTKDVRSGQLDLDPGYEHWMIKLDGVSGEQFGSSHGWGRIEMAYHLMARDCEIQMTECRLHEENGRAHFMTKRFDRDQQNNRHHVQTLCALKHFDYNQIGAYSYEQIFATMRELGLTYPDMEQLFRRMVFNALATNFDDHTKNFSFLLTKNGGWELSPAYDVCYAFDPANHWVNSHTITINGKQQGIGSEDFLAVAKHAGVKAAKANSIIEQTLSIIKTWTIYAEETEVEEEMMDEIHANLVAQKW
jgi:serine/threonine-protein kinase HipA